MFRPAIILSMVIGLSPAIAERRDQSGKYR